MTRVEQMKDAGSKLKGIRMPSELKIDLGKFLLPASKLKLDEKMKLVVDGRVTSLHRDQYGEYVCLEVSKLQDGDENA